MFNFASIENESTEKKGKILILVHSIKKDVGIYIIHKNRPRSKATRYSDKMRFSFIHGKVVFNSGRD